MRCPDLVGRDDELDRLIRRLDDLASGSGGLMVLVGDAGAGKSRLLGIVAEAAADRAIAVMRGRAVPGPSPEPYRPLREALLTASRTMPLPADPSLRGFEGHLAKLVPTTAAPPVEESPVLLAEAVVRLLSVSAGTRGCILVLEDLHWADSETLTVVDYLAENLQGGRALCLCSTRPQDRSRGLIGRADRLGAGAVVRLGPLADDAVVRMVAACLGVADPPADVAQFVVDHADGSPFVVEELLAGLVATGALRADGGFWEATGPLTPTVPADLHASLRQRLSSLNDIEWRVIAAAALLGRHFAWELLPGIAGVDGRAAADALRAAVGEQLIDFDGDGFMFRHALTRDAVLADLQPPERRQLAARAWPVVERANPGLPGPMCELAADLAEAAGDRAAAGLRLVESARRALVNGAFTSSEAMARRARALALSPEDDVALEADEVLVQVLAAAGKPLDALATGHALAPRLQGSGATPHRRADLLVSMARAALAAGDPASAASALDEARAAIATEPADPVGAQIDAVAGEVALDRNEIERAHAFARRAIEAAAATGQPAVTCEASLTLGRAMRTSDQRASRASFEEAAAVASAHGLARWHLRARQELALERWVDEGPAPMHEVRDLAARYGARVTVAVMDLSLADLYLGGFDRAACLRHAAACVEASRRFGLATEAVANLWLAGAHALHSDDAAMQSAIDAALDRDPADPRILGDLYGRVLVSRAFVRDELDGLRPLTDTMMDHVRRAPAGTSVFPGRILWALLATMDDEDLGAVARSELAEVVDRHRFPMFVRGAQLVEAIARGRGDDAAGASELAASAHQALAARPYGAGILHMAMMIVAQAATRDGWGDAQRWLRGAEAFFTDHGYGPTARRCRILLAAAGGPIPRRRGATVVPSGLRELGVTGREVEVLQLVLAGRTNRQIADELVLSPKTVERHLSNLFNRFSVRDRRALSLAAAPHLAG